MKKRTILILTLISIIAMVAGTAMAPAEGRSVRYLGARFINGKGAVFLFEYTGNISKAELRSAHAVGSNGMALNAHCVDKKDVNQIVCTVAGSKKYSEVGLYFMGQGFWASVPQEKVSGPPCLGFILIAPTGSINYISISSLNPVALEILVDLGYSPTSSGYMSYLEDRGGTIANRCVIDDGPYQQAP